MTPRKQNLINTAGLLNIFTHCDCDAQNLHKRKPDHIPAQRKGNRYKIHSLTKKLFAIDMLWVQENQFSTIQCHRVYHILCQAQK